MAVDSFEPDDRPPRWGADERRLVVDLDGYEGPLDVLLALARAQKVDLARISILQLANQYLDFIERAPRLEIAADYLVMAAWLAYLKSRLLLPEPSAEDEPTGEELAAALALQLRRLEAMREAGARLMDRPRLGRDVFARGAPEGVRTTMHPVFELSFYELLSTYGSHRLRTRAAPYSIRPSTLHSVDQALRRLSRLLGRTRGWQTLASFVPSGLTDGLVRRSAVASTFGASLELARRGRVRLRQSGDFGPIYLRASEKGR